MGVVCILPIGELKRLAMVDTLVDLTFVYCLCRWVEVCAGVMLHTNDPGNLLPLSVLVVGKHPPHCAAGIRSGVQGRVSIRCL